MPTPTQSLAVLALVGTLVVGCDVFTSVGPKSCDMSAEDNKPTDFIGVKVTNGVYMSSPWDSKLLYFPGGMVLDLEHGLGVRPTTWQAYLAFDVNGTTTGPVAPAAGNQVELVYSDDRILRVRNGTCSHYYLIVTAETGASP